MSPVLVAYEHFLRIAARIRWDAEAIDLSRDAERWPGLEPAASARVARFIGAFALAEQRVAADLGPFIAAAAPELAACFRAQARDEERHARFFERYADEVIGAEAAVDPRFAELFERRLRRASAAVAKGDLPLAEAVALYHLLLEGVVFSAGQNALLAELPAELPGLGDGLARIVADERWHIGLGVRVVRAAGGVEAPIAGRGEVEAWGELLSSAQREAALDLHRRRLRAAGVQGPFSIAPSPPSTPFATATS